MMSAGGHVINKEPHVVLLVYALHHYNYYIIHVFLHVISWNCGVYYYWQAFYAPLECVHYLFSHPSSAPGQLDWPKNW